MVIGVICKINKSANKVTLMLVKEYILELIKIWCIYIYIYNTHIWLIYYKNRTKVIIKNERYNYYLEQAH